VGIGLFFIHTPLKGFPVVKVNVAHIELSTSLSGVWTKEIPNDPFPNIRRH
jgi:hypothetical protein